MRKSTLRIITVFMLLVFTQKLGLRLWMHNWYHTEQLSQKKTNSPEKENHIQFKCDCIDDFLMPLTETSEFKVSIPVQNFITLLTNYHPPFSSAEKYFCSLKGPPVVS